MRVVRVYDQATGEDIGMQCRSQAYASVVFNCSLKYGHSGDHVAGDVMVWHWPDYECVHCGLKIEGGSNGTWWVKGTCQSQCAARASAKAGGYDDHVPNDVFPRPLVRTDLPVKGKGRSEAAKRVLG